MFYFKLLAKQCQQVEPNCPLLTLGAKFSGAKLSGAKLSYNLLLLTSRYVPTILYPQVPIDLLHHFGRPR